MAEVHIILTSFARDFYKERETITQQVVPELTDWCRGKSISVKFYSLVWGDLFQAEEKLTVLNILEKQGDRLDKKHVIVVNITSVEIGLVPSRVKRDPAHLTAVTEYEAKLRLTPTEAKLIQVCYASYDFQRIFLVRLNTFYDRVLPEERNFFVRPVWTELTKKLTRNALKALQPGQLFSYTYSSAAWDWEASRMDAYIPVHFQEKLLGWLRKTVGNAPNAENNSAFIADKLVYEARLLCFIHDQSQINTGRSEEIKQIKEYMQCRQSRSPMLLLGGPGYGKSTLVARVVDELLTTAEWNVRGCEPSAAIFYHSSTAIHTSTSLMFMLQRLLLSLEVVSCPANMPGTLAEAVTKVYKSLTSYETKNIIIIVDGMDQFEESHLPLVCSWIPEQLSPKVKVIVSTVLHSYSHKSLVTRLKIWKELHLLPFSFKDKVVILNNLLDKHKTVLGSVAREQLLRNKSCEHLLWLNLAVEDLSIFPSAKERDCRASNLPEDLQSLWEQQIQRVDDVLVKAALSLLFVSTCGLSKKDLQVLLQVNSRQLKPPGPFHEKAEFEFSEKEYGDVVFQEVSMPYSVLEAFCEKLCALLHHLPSNSDMFTLHYKPLRQAVWKVLFCQSDSNTKQSDGHNIEIFWRRHLVHHFAKSHGSYRRAKELLNQLVKLDNHEALVKTLSSWNTTVLFYDEDFSFELLTFWRQTEKLDQIVTTYRRLIRDLEAKNESGCGHEIMLRYEVLARILLQAGFFQESEELALEALAVEEKQFGKRDMWLVELYELLAEIQDEKIKLNDFNSRQQLPQLHRTIEFFRKSIRIRETLPGKTHKLKLAKSLMKLAFSLESWQASGGDHTLYPQQAQLEASQNIQRAIHIFEEMNDMGHYAEALMTKGIVTPTVPGQDQLQFYNQAMDICLRMYGEFSLLASRLHINTGIVYENKHDYVTAYCLFAKWAQLNEIIWGSSHPKTSRSRNVLKEPRYLLVAKRLKELTRREGLSGPSSENPIPSEIKSQINIEVKQFVQNSDGTLDEENNDDDEQGSTGSSLGVAAQLQTFLDAIGAGTMPVSRVLTLLEGLTPSERMSLMGRLISSRAGDASHPWRSSIRRRTQIDEELVTLQNLVEAEGRQFRALVSSPTEGGTNSDDSADEDTDEENEGTHESLHLITSSDSDTNAESVYYTDSDDEDSCSSSTHNQYSCDLGASGSSQHSCAANNAGKPEEELSAAWCQCDSHSSQSSDSDD